MAQIALAVIIWYGAGAVVQEQISLGGMILFTRFIDMLFHPIVVLGEQTNILFRAMAPASAFFRHWTGTRSSTSRTAGVAADRLRGEVRFDHLDFGYDADVQILHDVTFTIEPGEKLAIVGPTGSGKSTMIRLLGRFYDFDDGQIFLDGIDLNRIHTRDLRSRSAWCCRTSTFSRAPSTTTSPWAIRASPGRWPSRRTTGQRPRLHQRAAGGYDTELSERGQNLSQGQRQLLAFARVLAADPGDPGAGRGHRQHRHGNRAADPGRAAQLTRRPHLHPDCPPVADHSGSRPGAGAAARQVEEMGTHEELLASEGLYYTLHSLQFQEESVDDQSGE